ncbi:Uncharacterized protein Rs2_18594 [Raphanus sativus]|nr:Uncharacterized protein Rs2_18594 [Raphanus sativus]
MEAHLSVAGRLRRKFLGDRTSTVSRTSQRKSSRNSPHLRRSGVSVPYASKLAVRDTLLDVLFTELKRRELLDSYLLITFGVGDKETSSSSAVVRLRLNLISITGPAISGYCSPLLSWTDSVDQWLMCGFSKNLWLRRGNVGGRSLCLTSGTASLSTLVKLIYLNAVVKVALTTVIHFQQRLLLQYSLVLRSQSNAATDAKMEISSEKTYVLGIDGLLYVFDAVDGDRTPRSSKFRHQPENPTSKTTRQIQSVVQSLLKLEDCSPIALTEKANQTSSCRGYERSFSPSLLLIEVNLFTKILLSEKYLSLGFKTKEYRPLPNGVQSPGGSKESDPVKVARGVKAISRRTHSHWLRGLREETQLHFRKKDKAAIVQSTNAVEKVAKSSSKRAVSIMPTQVMEVELDKATNLTAVETPVIFIARPQLKLL